MSPSSHLKIGRLLQTEPRHSSKSNIPGHSSKCFSGVEATPEQARNTSQRPMGHWGTFLSFLRKVEPTVSHAKAVQLSHPCRGASAALHVPQVSPEARALTGGPGGEQENRTPPVKPVRRTSCSDFSHPIQRQDTGGARGRHCPQEGKQGPGGTSPPPEETAGLGAQPAHLRGCSFTPPLSPL